MSEAELAASPQGIIQLDAAGTILFYNQAQADLARRTVADTVGRNFFTQVALCTDVAEFRGRFTEFVAGADDAIQPFPFVFRFAHGQSNVKVTFVKRFASDSEAYVVVDVVPAKRRTRIISE